MISLKTFSGEFPRTQPQLLPDTAATRAVDCDFTRGNLIGIRERSIVPGFAAPAGIKSLFAYDGVASAMFAWTRDVDAVRSPIPSDAHSRFYWTDGAGFYVSRGDIGGNGQEPSTTNRYKVGCPTPAVAMTILEDKSKLALPGVSAITYAVFCEGVDGSATAERVLEAPRVSGGVTSWRGDWSTGIACSVAGTSGTPGTPTATGVTGLVFASQVDGPLPVMVQTDATGSRYYMHNPDYLNTPMGAGFGLVLPDGGMKTFFSIGSGWYCTKENAAIPAGAVTSTTSGSSSAATTPAMRLTFVLKSGATSTAIIRPSGVNTIPTDFASYAFTFNFNAGALALTIAAKSDYKEFRAYSYSYVNQFGEESGLAAPVTIDIVEGQAVTLHYTNLPDSEGYCPVSFIRIYRTATGSGGTDYSFVDEIVHNTTDPTYTDTLMGDELGAPSQSSGFEAPPQNLRGICVMGNGILVGFAGSDLYFMEPYLPYAYRPATIKPLPHKIVGICPTDDGLYVTTTAAPYLITGVSPDTMTDRRVPAVQAGVSKGSMCSLGATVAYASHDGIVLLRGIDASLEMSFQFFTRDSWRDRYASKLHLMRLNAHDGNIVVWFEDGTPGFLIRTEEGAASLTKLTDPIYAAFVYPLGDALYVAQGSTVYAFKGSTFTKAFKWDSKDFILPKPANFGCIQIVGHGTVSFEIFADGEFKYSSSVILGGNDTNVFRLPSGFLCRRWAVHVVGTAQSEVTELYLAGSPMELQNV